MLRETGSVRVPVAPHGESGAGTGHEEDWLLRAVKDAAAGEFEVLGEIDGGAADTRTYLARDLRTAVLVGLQLRPEGGAYTLSVVRTLAPGIPSLSVAQPPRAQPAPQRVGLQAVLLPTDAAPADEVLPPRPPQRRTSRSVYVGAAAAVVAIAVLAIVIRARMLEPDATQVSLGRDHTTTTVAAGVIPAAAAAPVPDSGRIQIAANLPRGATVTINGGALTRSPITLAPGTYRLAVIAPGYLPVADTLVLHAGQTLVWAPTLVAAPRAEPGAEPRVASRTTVPEPARDTASPAGTAPVVGPPQEPTCTSAYEERDWITAAALCARDARAGNVAAEHALGTLYDRGLGVSEDPVQAATWFRRAADAGSRDAAYRLGVMYEQGRGVPKAAAEAVAWYRKAALLGDPEAQVKLAEAYEHGTGVAKNIGEATTWYRKAAEQGNARAQNYLGFMYGTGKGVRRDDSAAVVWFRKAAEQGDAQAQYNLGFMYARGRGVPRDDDRAVMWFRRAARQGYRTAIEELDRRGVKP